MTSTFIFVEWGTDMPTDTNSGVCGRRGALLRTRAKLVLRRIWSPEGEQKLVLKGHTHAVCAVAVFPNGDIDVPEIGHT